MTGLSPRVTKRDIEKHFSTEGKVYFYRLQMPSFVMIGVYFVEAFLVYVVDVNY